MRQTSFRRPQLSKAAIIFPASFWMAMIINAINLGLVFYASNHFQATPTQIGILYGVYNLCYMLACLLFKKVLQRVQPQSCVIIATCGLLIGLVGYAFEVF